MGSAARRCWRGAPARETRATMHENVCTPAKAGCQVLGPSSKRRVACNEEDNSLGSVL